MRKPRERQFNEASNTIVNGQEFFGSTRHVLRGVARGGAGGKGRGSEPPWNLADQLTLFKPWGQIMPLTQLYAPPGFKKLSTPLVK